MLARVSGLGRCMLAVAIMTVTAATVVEPAVAAVTSSSFVSMTPCRVVDTRVKGGPFVANATRTFQVAGSGAKFAAQGGRAGGCAVPSTAVGVSASTTAVGPKGPGYVRAWPAGMSMPTATFLNYSSASITNTGVLTLNTSSSTADITVKDFGSTTHLVIDVQGYFVAGSSGSSFVSTAPCRVVDTASAGGALAANAQRTYQVAGTGSGFAAQGGQPGGCAIPANARSVQASITAVNPPGSGYLRAWPAGAAMPNATFLNFGSTSITNAGVLALNTSSATTDVTVQVFGSSTHVIIEIQGYFVGGTSGSSFVSMTPCRVVDTRLAGGAFAPGQARSYQVAGTGTGFAAQGGKANGCGIPATAVAVQASLTAVAPAGPGSVGIWPAGSARPDSTYVNYGSASITSTGVAALALNSSVADVTLGNNAGTAHLVIDVQGYFTAPGAPKVPGPPTGVAAVAASAKATVSWTMPAAAGGAAISAYVITPYKAGVAQPAITVAASPSSKEVTGLTNGVAYTFTVAAKNSAGTGPASMPSTAVTPGGAVAGGKTSRVLIDEAVMAGTIDANTAIVYKALAAFDSPNLPASYRSDVPDTGDASDMANAGRLFPNATAAQRGLLAPLFQPPIYRGSAYDLEHPLPSSGSGAEAPNAQAAPLPILRGDWASINGTHSRFWYPTGGPTEAKLRSAATVGRDALEGVIQPSLHALMNRDPMSDAGSHPFKDQNGVDQLWGDGGDGRTDFYLFDEWGHGGGQTVAYPPKCEATPAYVMLGAGNFGYGATNDFRNVVTHEYFHTYQYSYDLAEDCRARGLDEGTATWVTDHVYPSDDFEGFGPYLAEHVLEYGLSAHSYENWPFWKYLADTYGSTTIRQIWEGMASEPAWDVVGGLGEGLPTDLAGFSRYYWNRQPFPDFALDEPLVRHDLERPRALAPQDPQQYSTLENGGVWPDTTTIMNPDNEGGMSLATLDAHVPALGAYYHRFTMPDASARWLQWSPGSYPDPVNPIFGYNDFALKVQAVIRTGTTWRTEDWTYGASHCRALPNQGFDEILLIITNSSHEISTDGSVGHELTKTPTRKPRLAVSNVKCQGPWKATVDQSSLPYGVVTTSSLNSPIQLTRDPDEDEPDTFYFDSAPVSVSWTVNGIANTDGCSYSGSGTYTYLAERGVMELRWNAFINPTGAAKPQLFADLPTFSGPVTKICNGKAMPAQFELTGALYGSGGYPDPLGRFIGTKDYGYGDATFSYVPA